MPSFTPLDRASCALMLVAATVASIVYASPAAAALPRFAPPVDAPVTDSYRPPATPYGPGNRGWQYGTEPGRAVTAAGPGTVTFAGRVGGTLHVTIAHGGGLRTSYSFLASITVPSGRLVTIGQPIGTASDSFHFGVRVGDRYVDPAVLFRAGALRERARLVGAPRVADPMDQSATLRSRPAPG